MKKSINDLGDVKGKRALVRVDVNVPLDENHNVTDDTRIQAIVPTIKALKEKGAKIILMAHLGRPKGEWKTEFSLEPVAKYMSKVLGEDVLFVKSPVGEGADKELEALKDGQVALLENIRFYKAEEAKDDDMTFAEELAKLGDFYVNDAFGAAHRKHTSTAKVAHILKPAVAGLLMEKEIRCLSQALDNPTRPFTAVVGGAKVSSKIEIIENLLSKVDNLIIAGGMTYTFTKAMGGKIGISICEDDKLDLALDLIKKAKEKGVNLVLAVDAKIADAFSNDANTKFCPVNEIPDGWEGLDIGPKTEEIFANVIKESKTILWNGPTGVFEFDNFTHGSRAVGEAIVEATKNGAFSLVGGGDSVACVNKFGLASGVSYVSTGGGALLEAIEGKVLPGIAAINE